MDYQILDRSEMTNDFTKLLGQAGKLKDNEMMEIPTVSLTVRNAVYAGLRYRIKTNRLPYLIVRRKDKLYLFKS